MPRQTFPDAKGKQYDGARVGMENRDSTLIPPRRVTLSKSLCLRVLAFSVYSNSVNNKSE